MDPIVERILQVLEEHRQEIIEFGRDIYRRALRTAADITRRWRVWWARPSH